MVNLGGITLIVTGFPRSGTSMMMRILEFAGINILSDSAQTKQKHKYDPHGMRELENVGIRIKAKKKTWTKNKAVKIVTPYASWYPVDRPLKVIFMQRDLSEIVTSLLAMKAVWDEDIAESISWARGYLQYNEVPVLFVKYREAIDYPKTTVSRIQDFLGVAFDIDEVVKAIDKDARTRYKKDPTLQGHDAPDEIIRMDPGGYKDLKVEQYHALDDVDGGK